MKRYLSLLATPLLVISCANTSVEPTEGAVRTNTNAMPSNSPASSSPVAASNRVLEEPTPASISTQKTHQDIKIFPVKVSPFGQLKNETDPGSDAELEVNITPVSRPSEQVIKPPSAN